MTAQMTAQAGRPGGWLRHHGWVSIAAGLAALVMGASWALSFEALIVLAGAANISPDRRWLYPLTIDVLTAVALVAVGVLRSAPRRTRVYVWVVIAGAIAVSIVGNAAHASAHNGALAIDPLWAQAASAVPPMALAASVHLVVLMIFFRFPAPAALASAHLTAQVSGHELPTGLASEEAVPERPRERSGRRPDERQLARVRTLLQQAESEGRRATGAEVARALRKSDATGRRLLREVLAEQAAASAHHNGHLSDQDGAAS